MPQDKPVCRFCLETSHRANNPLLEPCNCKGSVQFVHKICLNRWRGIDPVRNDICNLCRTPYIFIAKQMLEELPPVHSWLNFSLSYPYIPFIAVVYLWIFHQAMGKRGTDPFQIDLFPYYQVLFHLVYAVFFLRNFHVKHPERYRSLWVTQGLLLNVSSHTVTLYLSINGYPLLSLSNVYLCGYYWRHHSRILQQINTELLE
jgi:hypothetical protein